MSADFLGVYIHWPFCLSKCPYCDFNVHVRDEIDHVRWAQNYMRALEHYAALTPGWVVQSVFFGGGTPSTMAPETVQAVIDKIRALWPCVNDWEVTLEANPTSVEIENLQAFKDAGVNRVSLGVQALNDADLKFLGRKHSADEALRAIDVAGDVFERVSFDLMYGRPDQTLEAWRSELTQAAELARGHLSLYQLTIERSTPFYFDHAQGRFSVPDEDLSSDFYMLTQDVLEEHGLPAYETSNHAVAGQESRHNLIYWNYDDYIGIGPGAHGRLTLDGQKQATREHHAPDIWLQNVEAQGHGAHGFTALSQEEQFLEALMMGLRLREGVSVAKLSTIGGQDWQAFIDADKFKAAGDEGWMILEGDCLRLSREGMLRLNALIPFILRAEEPRSVRRRTKAP